MVQVISGKGENRIADLVVVPGIRKKAADRNLVLGLRRRVADRRVQISGREAIGDSGVGQYVGAPAHDHAIRRPQLQIGAADQHRNRERD